MTRTFVEMSTVVVVAQLRTRRCSPDGIAELLHLTHSTLLDLSRPEATQKRENQAATAQSETLADLRQRPQQTVQRSQVICLECGQMYRQLSRHHLVMHGLTAKTYKKKWGIPLGQPLSARSLTQRRRQKAKARDAGQYLALWRAQRHQPTTPEVADAPVWSEGTSAT